MFVKDIMTKDVKTCRPQDTLHIAARLMWENDCGCVPVVEGTTVVGMITDRDICMAAYFQGKPLMEIPVSSSMSKGVASCRPEDTIENAERAIRSRKVRRLPVVDGKGKLVGILSLNDIAREAARERTSTGQEVTDAEVGETLSVVCEPHAKRSK